MSLPPRAALARLGPRQSPPVARSYRPWCRRPSRRTPRALSRTRCGHSRTARPHTTRPCRAPRRVPRPAPSGVPTCCRDTAESCLRMPCYQVPPSTSPSVGGKPPPAVSDPIPTHVPFIFAHIYPVPYSVAVAVAVEVAAIDPATDTTAPCILILKAVVVPTPRVASAVAEDVAATSAAAECVSLVFAVPVTLDTAAIAPTAL